MTKVITYGTYDLLHYGHIRLLERAKALGDYLIVGVTSDDFDKARGKINNQQSLMERVAAIKETGLADEIIIEEYEGQKIDDIKSHGVDIFTVGSDWKGKFDYLNEYCKVIYLDRTEGVSSSEIRAERININIFCSNHFHIEKKFIEELKYVNGITLNNTHYDAKYIVSKPESHFEEIKAELEKGINVLCESPISIKASETNQLFEIAQKHNCTLFDGIKTAYSTAFSRMILLVKSGIIGEVVSIDATCTNMSDYDDKEVSNSWNSICSWGPTGLLPIFQILGTKYTKMNITSKYYDKDKKYDAFTKVDFLYPNAVASIKVAKKAKSEGELIITGTKGYILVPAPWWKTDYFEVRFEDPKENKRYFYQLDGEGIRFEIAAFLKTISRKKDYSNVLKDVSIAISQIIEDYYENKMDEIL